MLYISDRFEVSNVPVENFGFLRFDEISESQVKKMLVGSNPIAGFSNHNAARVMNVITSSVLGIISPKEPLGSFSFGCHDVLILVVAGKTNSADSVVKFYRVTARRDYEVFGFNGTHVVLDRDGNIMAQDTDYEKLTRYCDSIN